MSHEPHRNAQGYLRVVSVVYKDKDDKRFMVKLWSDDVDPFITKKQKEGFIIEEIT